jgi:hypothetical protein
MYKGTYDDFGWIVALAPAEDPQIAICVMVVQAGGSSQTAPIAREVIGAYFELQAQYAAEGTGNVDFNKFFKEYKANPVAPPPQIQTETGEASA